MVAAEPAATVIAQLVSLDAMVPQLPLATGVLLFPARLLQGSPEWYPSPAGVQSQDSHTRWPTSHYIPIMALASDAFGLSCNKAAALTPWVDDPISLCYSVGYQL